MHRWPPLQGRRNEICRRHVKSIISNCSYMVILGTKWKAWYSMVSEQTCTIHHKMDQSMWQTLESIDLIYIHHTCEYKQYCYVGNTAQQCRLGLFQDSDFASELEDSKSTSGGILCIFASHTFVPKSLMCKKQTSVSHSSTESKIISLDAGLRLDGIPALDLWDLIVAVLGNTNQNRTEQGDLLKKKREVCFPPHTIHKRKQSQRVIKDLDTVDFITSNVPSSQQEALLYIFEDHEAVIKMIIKGRSPTMRHVSRTHRVALDWLFDRITLNPKIQMLIKIWSSQQWKSDELMEDRTGRPVVFAQHTDKSAKEAEPILKRCNRRQRQTLCDMENVCVFYITRICIDGEDLLRQFTFYKKKTEDLTMKQMFDISEKLITEQSDEIYGVNTTDWEDSSWKYLSLVSDEDVISLSHAKVYVFSDSVFCLGKMHQNSQSNTVWEDKLTWFKSPPECRALDKIDVEPMEFEWNNFPGFTTLQLCHTVQELLSKLSVEPEEFHWTDYLHVDVQRHLIGISRQWTRMRIKRSARFY